MVCPFLENDNTTHQSGGSSSWVLCVSKVLL